MVLRNKPLLIKLLLLLLLLLLVLVGDNFKGAAKLTKSPIKIVARKTTTKCFMVLGINPQEYNSTRYY